MDGPELPAGAREDGGAAAGRRRARLLPALVALGVAEGFTVVMATRNYLLWRGPGMPSWTWHLLREIPLWFPWLLFLPLVLALSRRFPFRRGEIGRSALAHALSAPLIVSAIVVVSTLGQYPLESQLPRQRPPLDQLLRRNVVALVPFVITNYLWIVALHQALQRGREARAAAVERERLLRLLNEARIANLHNRVRLSDARLANLHSQVQPHFLFNALHGISSLMATDVPGARRMLTKVSELLRLSLDRDASAEVTVDEELDLVERYLDLQKLRFEDHLHVDLAVAPEGRRALMPSFLLQTLVENAVRHGAQRVVAGPGRLEVEVGVADASLRVRVADNGPGFPAQRGGSGGLANLEERLELLYGFDHELRIANRDGGGAEVHVRIPLRLRPRGELTGAGVAEDA